MKPPKKPRNRIDYSMAPKSVYFIRAVGLDAIKIGFATDVHSRFRSVAVCCPVPVELLGYISSFEAAEIERRWHVRYRSDRIRGEWFRETPELLAAIAEADAAPKAEDEALRVAFAMTYPAKA
jgi:hypothetical protein